MKMHLMLLVYRIVKIFSIFSYRWLSFPNQGEKSSRDEQGACAMLATQLDSFLGGEPVQHRQVQGYESPEFMGLFPKGVSYKVRVTHSSRTKTAKSFNIVFNKCALHLHLFIWQTLLSKVTYS